MKWPNNMVFALTNLFGPQYLSVDNAEQILDRLSEIGALKEVPKKQERWECVYCEIRSSRSRLDMHDYPCRKEKHEILHFVEADND